MTMAAVDVSAWQHWILGNMTITFLIIMMLFLKLWHGINYLQHSKKRNIKYWHKYRCNTVRVKTHQYSETSYVAPPLSCLYWSIFHTVPEVVLYRHCEFGVLCCLTTPGLRKDIRRQIRQLYSHKVTYYVHYNYILSSHLLSHSRFYFCY